MGIRADHSVTEECGQTVVEVMVAVVLFSLLSLAVGTALDTGSEIYTDGLLRAERDGHARRVLSRILNEIGQTRSDSPAFDVGADFIAYSPVIALTATEPTFGADRIIKYSADEGRIYMAIPSEYIVEDLTTDAAGMTLVLDGMRLTVSVTITKIDINGEKITRTVTGETYVRQ